MVGYCLRCQRVLAALHNPEDCVWLVPVARSNQLSKHVQKQAMVPRHDGDKCCWVGGPPWQSNNPSLLLFKDLLTFPFLLPTLTGLEKDHVTWRLFEQLQIQNGIFIPVSNINLEKSMIWLFTFETQLHSLTSRKQFLSHPLGGGAWARGMCWLALLEMLHPGWCLRCWVTRDSWLLLKHANAQHLAKQWLGSSLMCPPPSPGPVLHMVKFTKCSTFSSRGGKEASLLAAFPSLKRESRRYCWPLNEIHFPV